MGSDVSVPDHCLSFYFVCMGIKNTIYMYILMTICTLKKRFDYTKNTNMNARSTLMSERIIYFYYNLAKHSM